MNDGPLHFLGLRGAATMGTRDLQMTRRVVQDINAAAAMGAIHGDAGLGKTFAVAFSLHEQTTEHCTIEMAGRATMRNVAQQLLRGLTGIAPVGDRFLMTEDLLDVLAQKPRIIVVDEAQRLNHECIEYLRHLHDHRNTTFSLLLVGGNGCWDVLQRYPMLRSRVYRAHGFASLSWEDISQIIPGFHAIYVEADPEVLALVDEVFAHGNFRRWAAFTKTAHEMCEQLGEPTLTERIAQNAMGLIGGSRP